MNRLLPKPRDIVVVDNEIVPRPKSGVAKSSAISVLAILLGLVSMSYLGPDFAYIGSWITPVIPALIIALVVHKAFNHTGMAAVTGILVIATMAWAGALDNFIANAYQFLMAISRVAGYVAGLILAIMIGVAWSMRKS